VKLEDLGEFGLIARLARGCIVAPERVVVDIGDDCAATENAGGRLRLVTTDLLIERVHFLRRAITPKQLGAKAMAVNLSDIAAMGGRPLDAFVSLALPDDLSVEYVEALYDGLREMSAAFGVNILGGDTTASLADLVISIALTGEVERERMLRRRGARPGDRIWVTGTLGDAAAGLDAILQQRAELPEAAPLVARHLGPQPHVAAGRVIAESGLGHAMLDLSDGLSSDLRHLCEASGVGCVVDASALPISPALRTYAERFGLDPIRLALDGGEDYVLCVAGDAGLGAALGAAGHSAFAIGEIRAEPTRWVQRADGERHPLLPRGFDHLRCRDAG
jgi:thiamine-monophosphate kinase